MYTTRYEQIPNIIHATRHQLGPHALFRPRGNTIAIFQELLMKEWQSRKREGGVSLYTESEKSNLYGRFMIYEQDQ